MYTLMLVDDEINITEGIKHMLDWKALGFMRIETARSSTDVVANVLNWKPDVSLVDVRIGRDYGYNLIKNLNDLGVRSNYIMMSGYDEFDYACEAIRCGALDYMLKPIDRAQLQERIEKIIVEKLGGTLQKLEDKRNQDPILGMQYHAMPPLIRKIVMMVSTEYGRHVSLKSIADRFKMNATYLGQIFIKETGCKFSEYLMLYRLHIAREQILNSDEKIAVIAAGVGYANMTYFYQHFQACYHISPTEMRAGR